MKCLVATLVLTISSIALSQTLQQTGISLGVSLTLPIVEVPKRTTVAVQQRETLIRFFPPSTNFLPVWNTLFLQWSNVGAFAVTRVEFKTNVSGAWMFYTELTNAGLMGFRVQRTNNPVFFRIAHR